MFLELIFGTPTLVCVVNVDARVGGGGGSNGAAEEQKEKEEEEEEEEEV